MQTLALLLALLPQETPGPVPTVAVFDVALQGATSLSKADGEALTNYLATVLAEGDRFKVIPRGQLKGVLATQKSKSYESCVDESCQIEIGRELAAQKSLLTQIARLGSKCLLTATLYDLRTAASERAATRTTACKVDVLVEALGEVARELRAGGAAASKEAAPATKAARERYELSVESTPPGAAVYAGLTFLGATPLRESVVEGSYELLVEQGRRVVRRTVAVGRDGASVAFDLSGQAAKRGGACEATSLGHVAEAKRDAVGKAWGAGSPLALAHAARYRALLDLGRQVGAEAVKGQFESYTYSDGTPVPKQPDVKTTVHGPVIVDEATCGGDTYYARVAAPSPFIVPQPIVGRGAGDVTSFGPSGPALEASAALGALADALVWHALADADVTTSSLVKEYSDGAGGERGREVFGKIEATRTLEGKAGTIGVKVIVRDQEKDATVGGAYEGEQLTRVLYRLELSPVSGAAETIDVADGVGLAADPEAALRTLSTLVDGLGVTVQLKKLPRTAGAPRTDATLRAKTK